MKVINSFQIEKNWLLCRFQPNKSMGIMENEIASLLLQVKSNTIRKVKGKKRLDDFNDKHS